MDIHKKDLFVGGFIVLILVVGIVSAIDFPVVKDKYVNDYVGILSDEQRIELRGVFESVDEQTTAEIVFVSLESIDGADIGDYAIQLGQEWKVGKSDKDNGLVILYVKDISRIFAATGYGIEGILPDSKVGRLLDENYVPLRNSGNVGQGIVEFSKSVSEVMFEYAEEIMSGNASRNNATEIIGALIPILIWILIFFFIFYNNYKRRKKDKRYNDFPWWVLLFMPTGRSSGGFGGGGFGGGGFGGGGFGGGGAGR